MTAGEAAVAIAVLGLPFAIVFGAGVAVGYWWRGYRRRTTGATPRQRDSSTNEALGVRFGGLVVRPSGLPGGGRNWFGAGVSLTPDHLQACGVDGIAVRLFAAGGAVRIAGAGAPEECDDRVRDKWLGTDAAYAVEVAALGILDLSISKSERLFTGRWPRRWFALAGVPDGKIGDPESGRGRARGDRRLANHHRARRRRRRRSGRRCRG